MAQLGGAAPSRLWIMVAGIAASIALLYLTCVLAPRTAGSSAAPPPTATEPSTSGDATPGDATPQAPADAARQPAASERSAPPTTTTPDETKSDGDLHGSVHDKASGERLYDFEVAAWTHGLTSAEMPHVRTDANGEFAFAGFPFDASKPTVLVSLIDDPSIRRKHSGSTGERVKLEIKDASAPYAQPFRLEAYVGPTVGFEVEFPAGLSEADFSAVLDSSPPTIRSWRGAEMRSALRAPLGYGPHANAPWTRFGEPTEIADRVWVELQSNDRRWRGGAWLLQLAGVVETPLRIQLEPATRMVGRFIWPAGVEDDFVQLKLSVLHEDGTVGASLSGGASSDGAFAFEFLLPGRYRLATTNAGWKPFTLDVDLRAGENDVGAHALEPRRVVGAVRGTIRSRSGRYEGACHASLSNVAFAHDAPFDHSIDFEPVDENDPNSERVAHFEFENVTEGAWLLYVHCHDGFEFPGSLTTVQAPADGLEIWIDDPACSVRVELVESDTGRPCDAAQFHWRCGDEFDLERGAVAEIASLPDDPKRFTWVASAPGRRLRVGTGADLTREAPPDGRVQLVGVVRLDPGFGALLTARHRGGLSALAGVEVRCDDVLVGRTDAKGQLLLSLASKPARITLSKPGWIHVSNRDFKAATGAFSDDAELYAEFEPERP